MTINLTYNKLFVYSEEKARHFYTEFSQGINIVHGRNTSGKSTLFLSILYNFGINDGNQYLKDILDEKVIFRLDCTLTKQGVSESLILIRDEDTLYIKKGSDPIKRFNGISQNQSNEHIKLKVYISEIFEFSMHLESKNEYKPAPMETMFLPYYISQTVGWVYLRKSFSSLDFYKNFKEDYLDYYLGLEPSLDRVERHKLEDKLKVMQSEISLIQEFEIGNEDIQLTKLTDEQFIETSNGYIETYSKNHTSLTKEENDYVIQCNELAFLQQRKSVLQRVGNDQKGQAPDGGNCPTCSQSLPFGISETYKFLQEQNNTDSELVVVKAKIKDVQSKINSLEKAIGEKRHNIAKDYSVLNKYVNSDITYDKWIKNKANTELIQNLQNKIGKLTLEKSEVEKQLKNYKTEDDILEARKNQSSAFTALFITFLRQLGVKELEEERYIKLYQISAFPSQGVELHKTIMAYHFAFNSVIAGTDNIHRLPFMLDAIFKEDLEDLSKNLILKFINDNRPKDTQIIFSIAQAKGQPSNADKYNSEFFENKAKLIPIGDGQSQRAFLQEYKNQYREHLDHTLQIINGSIT